MTLSYYGAEKVVANYNVMGVAKAALEASVRYLARGSRQGRHPRERHQRRADPDAGRAGSGQLPPDVRLVPRDIAPLRRNVTIEDVGGTAVYLASDLSAGVTGETIYVDAGFNMLGVPTPES